MGLLAILWIGAIAARGARLERRVDLLIRAAGLNLVDHVNLSDRVKEIAQDPSRKIEAIRVYREETGCGLAEAKDAVELYLDSLKT